MKRFLFILTMIALFGCEEQYDYEFITDPCWECEVVAFHINETGFYQLDTLGTQVFCGYCPRSDFLYSQTSGRIYDCVKIETNE
jgi:hypothetical protein